MITSVTQVFVGFSVLAAPVLLVAYLCFLRDMSKSVVGRAASIALLGSMFCLQVYHWLFLQSGIELFDQRVYLFLLLAVPPAFFFFSREVLVAGSTRSPLHALHIAPLALSSLLPLDVIPPATFVLATGYSTWFAVYVFGLRRHVHRYLFELFFFSFFAVLAIVLLVLAISAANIGTEVFYISYALLSGATFVVIVAAMIWFPHILVDLPDAARLAYAQSTLNGVDIDDKLTALERCMASEKLYQNEDLNLGLLASVLDLNPHQLSELINTRFGYGFSRYVREQRVAEARRLLKEDRSASVLSIGLTTGFRSQSNFYAAFREITGESPGAYRDRHSES